ncbi:DUF5512 family protein [Bacillus sp. FSL R9-9410]|uniref:DUF5512 family protein n=1 Tax=Bacillus sp. FSL R9-9410 TaxID=2921590 RepID=UPI00310139BD
MVKKIKWLPLLFVLLSAFLVGCGGPTLPYAKGDMYKDGSFIEVLNENEWKVHGYRDNDNQYAIYKVEPTEYYSGKYTVVKMSKKTSYGGADPFILQKPNFYLLAPTKNGFSMRNVGAETNGVVNWNNDFEKKFNDAKDKEAFLKETAEKATRKFEKTN